MNILILSPHTDDAELGAGGYIARLLEEGHYLKFIVFSTAKESNDINNDILAVEFQAVIDKLGIETNQAMVYSYTVRRLNESRQDVLEILYAEKDKFMPDLVIGPSVHDCHQDHIVVANEMIRAFRTCSSIISYELPRNHLTFNNQYYVPLEERHIQKKLDILSCYQSQVKKRDYFDEEYIRGLARSRGVQICRKYAEVYEVIRWII